MNSKPIFSVLVIVLALNLMVAAAKIIYGKLTGSISMEADGFHSLMDGGSTAVGMLGIWKAFRPPDRIHPYGHRKIEMFSSLLIAGLLILTGLQVAEAAIERLMAYTVPRVTPLSFAVMLMTMGINLVVTTYENRKGKELKSEILVADALHTRSDIFVSLGVIISLIAVELGYPILDIIGGIVIALIIARAGFLVIRQSSSYLLDTSILDTDMLCRIALEIEGVEDCHHIRTRGVPDEIYVDLHVKVRKDMHMEDAHRIAHEVETHIKDRVEGVRDVVIHLEPFRTEKRVPQ